MEPAYGPWPQGKTGRIKKKGCRPEALKGREKMKKSKKVIAPNECSLVRWILAVLVGFVAASLLSMPLLVPLQENPELAQSTVMGIPLETAGNLLSFVAMFWGTALCLKLIAKTSLKDFILGVGGKADKKECLMLIGLHTLGLGLSFLLSVPNISLRGVELSTFLALLVFAALVTWTQTSWEELVFRGVFLRWACKNKLAFTKKAIIVGAVSSFLFAVSHLANPEISSMKGLELVIGVCCYILPGVVFYVTDLYFGSLLPGLVLHWINNFVLFTLISGEVTALAMPTLLVDRSPQGAWFILAGTILSYAPEIVYMIWHYRKHGKTAAQLKA